MITEIRLKALEVAQRNLYGESGANNSGPFITAMGGIEGREWCALYVGFCYRRAYQLVYKQSGTPDWLWRRPGVPETGAKRLTRNLGAIGRTFKDPEYARPGDLVCWSRGTLGWQGHVGMVVHSHAGIIRTLEGNVGRFPARVHYLDHDVRKERLFCFASLDPVTPVV